jgi:hypothetical protein
MKTIIIYLITLLVVIHASQNSYELGRGYTVHESENQSLKIAGHFSSIVALRSNAPLSVYSESLGVILYGKVVEGTRYLIEYGADSAITREKGVMHYNKIIRNRLYIEQELGEESSLKIGQFLTPIGIWNPIYISALRTSISTPYVADDFFPKIITGVGFKSQIAQDIGYSLFYHTDKETDQNKEHIRTRDFAGGEIFYTFGLKGRVAIPFGHYKSFSSKDESMFSGLNFLLPLGKDTLSFEYLYMDKAWKERSWVVQAGYLQYRHKLSAKHYLSSRIGSHHHLNKFQDDEVTLGYLYQRKHASSLKVETRHHRYRGTTKRVGHDLFLSFAVLF